MTPLEIITFFGFMTTAAVGYTLSNYLVSRPLKTKKKEVPVFSKATASASSVTKVETTFVNPPTVATPKSLADVRAVLTKIDDLTKRATELKYTIADISAPGTFLGITSYKDSKRGPSESESYSLYSHCYKDHVTYKLPDDLLQVVKKALLSERVDLLKQIKELEASVTASITTGENDR